MISRQTRQIFQSLAHRPIYFKPPNHELLSLSSFVFPTITSPYPMYSRPQKTFSNSSKDDNDPNSSKKGSSRPKSQTSKTRVVSPEASTAKNTTITPLSNNDIKPKKLLAVPLKPLKLILTSEEEKIKPKTYILESAKTSIIPFTKHTIAPKAEIPEQYKYKKRAFFIKTDRDEIYTVGVILDIQHDKTKTDDKSIDLEPNETANHKNNKDKPKHYKVKLVEIEVKDNVVLAKAIPYNDSKLTPSEQQINVKNVLSQIANLAQSIRQAVFNERLDLFGGPIFEWIHSKNIDPENIDEPLCQLLLECEKLYANFKENFRGFVQAFLEERSPIVRMFMVKKKLEEIKNVLDIVNKSHQHADEQILKFQEQAKARLSLDFIKANFLSGAVVPPVGGKIGRDGRLKQGESSVDPIISEQAKKFMEKLHLIEDEVSKEKVKKEIEKLSMQDKASGEYYKLYMYLDEVFSVPWGKHSKEYWDINYSKQVLEKELFGLTKVKERIIEMIAVNKLQRTLEEFKGKKKGFVILINGPPGTGKTTVAKSIAKALKRESRFISFAGVTDPAFVKGHKRTYVDAQPGVFVRELIKSKVMNPVFILDEMDKLSANFQGVDPYYALMEILNPEENHNFTDHFLDIKVDFSNVIFILTSNQVLNMLEPLLNRLEIIEVPAYIEQEKLIIAKNYLLPAVLKEHELPSDNVVFDDESIRRMIKGWCYYESGVRELRRCFEKIARKQALSIINIYQKEQADSVEINAEPPESKDNNDVKSQQDSYTKAGNNGKNGSMDQGIEFLEKIAEIRKSVQNNKDKDKTKITSNEEDFTTQESSQMIQLKNQNKLVFDARNDPNDELLKKYLGNPDFDDMYERRNRKPFIGTANVLTVSGFVGHVMTVECIFDTSSQTNKGVFSSSGNIEKVLQESLTIARLVAFKFLPEDKIKEILEKNIHVHFLQGGIPKDGPSAGLSICAAFLSLMLDKQIPQDISMTGELSLHGYVHKIGGVQAKITASKTLEINRIILPWGNRAEFFGLPQMLKEDLTVYFVKEFKEVYNILFDDKPENLKNIARFADGKFIEPERSVGISENVYLDVKES